VTADGDRTTVTLANRTSWTGWGGSAPRLRDGRLQVSVTLTCSKPGRITRTDVYSPTRPLQVTDLTLEFGSFLGARAQAEGPLFTRFSGVGQGAWFSRVRGGWTACRAPARRHLPRLTRLPTGPMQTPGFPASGARSRLSRPPSPSAGTLDYGSQRPGRQRPSPRRHEQAGQRREAPVTGVVIAGRRPGGSSEGLHPGRPIQPFSGAAARWPATKPLQAGGPLPNTAHDAAGLSAAEPELRQ